MAEYSVAKNIEEHASVVKDFCENIPANRGEWSPPIGYMLEADSYHHSRKKRTIGAYADRVGSSKTVRGVKWRAVAKARATWHFNGKGRNYKVYTTILWAEENE